MIRRSTCCAKIIQFYSCSLQDQYVAQGAAWAVVLLPIIYMMQNSLDLKKGLASLTSMGFDNNNTPECCIFKWVRDRAICFALSCAVTTLLLHRLKFISFQTKHAHKSQNCIFLLKTNKEP